MTESVNPDSCYEMRRFHGFPLATLQERLPLEVALPPFCMSGTIAPQSGPFTNPGSKGDLCLGINTSHIFLAVLFSSIPSHISPMAYLVAVFQRHSHRRRAKESLHRQLMCCGER
jgi:hypothetical protein